LTRERGGTGIIRGRNPLSHSDDAFVDCGDNKECDCKPVQSELQFLISTPPESYNGYTTPFTMTRTPLVITTCAASLGEVRENDRHMRINTVGLHETHVFRIDEKDLDGDERVCNGGEVKLYVFDNAGMATSELISGITENDLLRDYTLGIASTTKGRYYIALANIAPNNDCIVTVTVT
jgi:hypothetical protein